MTSKIRHSRYKSIVTQLRHLLPGCDDHQARMATVASLLHHKLNYFSWTGFYLYKDDKLVVGPYQGPLACMTLKKNKGVCWRGFNTKKTIIVPDVVKFHGHIACDPRSKSEIVVPMLNNQGEIVGVLDADSREHDAFKSIDADYLEQIVAMIHS